MTTTDLRLSGMSCASCAARVERSLNQIDGVQASVNFAVEQAHVEHGPQTTAEDLVRAVESSGYRAAVIDHDHRHDHHDHMAHDVPQEQLRSRCWRCRW
jgi:Cu+-exporting ATPase